MKVSLLIFLILNKSPSIIVGASLVLVIEKELRRIFNFYNKISQYSVNSALILQPHERCVFEHIITFSKLTANAYLIDYASFCSGFFICISNIFL